jgi:hypothetical protein
MGRKAKPLRLNFQTKIGSILQPVIKLLSVIIVLALLVFLTPKLRFLLDEKLNGNTTITKVMTTVYPPCDLLAGICEVDLIGERKLAFTFDRVDKSREGDLLIGMFALQSKVLLGEEPQRMSLRIEGRDMFMGVIDRELLKLAPTSFVLPETSFPACSVDTNMVWLLIAQVEYASQVYKVVFEIRNRFH